MQRRGEQSHQWSRYVDRQFRGAKRDPNLGMGEFANGHDHGSVVLRDGSQGAIVVDVELPAGKKHPETWVASRFP